MHTVKEHFKVPSKISHVFLFHVCKYFYSFPPVIVIISIKHFADKKTPHAETETSARACDTGTWKERGCVVVLCANSPTTWLKSSSLMTPDSVPVPTKLKHLFSNLGLWVLPPYLLINSGTSWQPLRLPFVLLKCFRLSAIVFIFCWISQPNSLRPFPWSPSGHRTRDLHVFVQLNIIIIHVEQQQCY